MKVRITKKRMSVLEFERSLAKQGVFVYWSDIQAIRGRETFSHLASYDNLIVSTMPNTVNFYNGDWDEWITFCQVKYIDVVKFTSFVDRRDLSPVYCTVVCAGWHGDIKHTIIVSKNH